VLEVDSCVAVSLHPEASAHRCAVREAAQRVGLRLRDESAPAPVDEIPPDEIRIVDLTSGGSGPIDGLTVLLSDHPEKVDEAVEPWDCLTPSELHRLPRVLKNLSELLRLRRREQQERETVEVLNRIGYALSAIRDGPVLWESILSEARKVLKADAGTLYVVREGRLHFAAAQNDTVTFEGASEVLSIDDNSLAGHSARLGRPLNVADVRMLPPEVTYRLNLDFDRRTGYQTRSMLLVPMQDRHGHSTGVLALINHKVRAGQPLSNFDSEVMPFSSRDVDLASSIASQAALALENHRLVDEIRRLFEGFIEASVAVVETRDPPTGGHSQRVADLTLELAGAVNASKESPFAQTHFSLEQLRELRYAGMLHDFGKIAVREEILSKALKLFPHEITRIEHGFLLVEAQERLRNAMGQTSRAELHARLQQIQCDRAFVRKANYPNWRLGEEDRAELERIASRWILLDSGESVLQPSDVARLGIAFGSLDEGERRDIQSHVEHTVDFLRRIPWTSDLRSVPEIAAAHHERLDGTGYPWGRTAGEIPLGARLMAVADIFDALTAVDRPYRKGISAEQAIRLLRDDAAQGKLDPSVVDLFTRLKAR
jgi:HD-GYP domain-containing protein (c-di-GMP phosphodiesterase class II)